MTNSPVPVLGVRAGGTSAWSVHGPGFRTCRSHGSSFSGPSEPRFRGRVALPAVQSWNRASPGPPPPVRFGHVNEWQVERLRPDWALNQYWFTSTTETSS